MISDFSEASTAIFSNGPFPFQGTNSGLVQGGPLRSFRMPRVNCLINWQLGFITLLIGVIHIVIQCCTPFCKWLKGPTNSNFWTESGGIWFWMSLAGCWLQVPQIFLPTRPGFFRDPDENTKYFLRETYGRLLVVGSLSLRNFFRPYKEGPHHGNRREYLIMHFFLNKKTYYCSCIH